MAEAKKPIDDVRDPDDDLQIDSELRDLFGFRGFDYVPDDAPTDFKSVRIEVKPLTVDKFLESSTVIARIMVMFANKVPLHDVASMLRDDIKDVLRPLVIVPAGPHLKIDNLPADVLPQCLGELLRSFSLGKWQKLDGEIKEKFRLERSLWQAVMTEETSPSES